MEINVGDYVIQKDRLKIGQVKDFCECEMCKDRGFYEPIIDNDIYITNYDKDNNFKNYTFSKDIIDLIEVGDYVNGSKVIDIRTDEDLEIGVESDYLICHYIQNKDIKSILTHEQFEANAYKIEKEV